MTVTPVVALRPTPYDHPDVVRLTEQAQRLYEQLYGGRDSSPVDVRELSPPRGRLYVAYDPDGVALAMGGWRLVAPEVALVGERPAEVKRMYVAEHARRRGLARLVLDHLEQTARDAGVDHLVLETGRPQVEAIALYRSCGYTDVTPFGHYRDSPLSVPLGKPLT